MVQLGEIEGSSVAGSIESFTTNKFRMPVQMYLYLKVQFQIWPQVHVHVRVAMLNTYIGPSTNHSHNPIWHCGA